MKIDQTGQIQAYAFAQQEYISGGMLKFWNLHLSIFKCSPQEYLICLNEKMKVIISECTFVGFFFLLPNPAVASQL